MAQRALTPGNAAHCTECGVATRADAAACARCGQPFVGSIQAVLCPICNSINPAGASKCVNCEARFPEPGTIGPPAAATKGSPEENLRRILRLSRQKARSRTGSKVPKSVLPSAGPLGSPTERKPLKIQRQPGRPHSGPKGVDARRSAADSELAALRQRVGQFEDQMERWVGERDRLQEQVNELVRMKDELDAAMRSLNGRADGQPHDGRVGSRPSRSGQGSGTTGPAQTSSERAKGARPPRKSRKT